MFVSDCVWLRMFVSAFVRVVGVCVCLYACVCVCVFVYACVCVRMIVHVYVLLNMFVYVGVCSCIFVYAPLRASLCCLSIVVHACV